MSLSADARQALLDAMAGDGSTGGTVEGDVRFDEPMARHTTLRLGGPVDAWVMPRHYQMLARVREVMAARDIPTFGIGSGSNLLVRDGGLRGVAINLRHMSRVGLLGVPNSQNAREERAVGEGSGELGSTEGGRERPPVVDEDGANIWVEAGAATGRVLAFCTINELGGVEFLGGVPGTVGGGMIMNAGTYLGEFKDVTTRVFSIDAAGQTIVRDHAQCGFAYRTSSIPASEVVTHARLRLTKRPRAEIDEAVRSLRDRRKAREPSAVPNAGSIFKNPHGDFAGRLIEAAGLKGRRVGGAEVSPVHANWLVNADKGKAKDLLDLIEIVRAEVVQRFGVRLELEVKVVGEE